MLSISSSDDQVLPKDAFTKAGLVPYVSKTLDEQATLENYRSALKEIVPLTIGFAVVAIAANHAPEYVPQTIEKFFRAGSTLGTTLLTVTTLLAIAGEAKAFISLRLSRQDLKKALSENNINPAEIGANDKLYFADPVGAKERYELDCLDLD